MNLRRVLFEYRVNQSAMARAVIEAGARLYASQISATASGSYRASPKERANMRLGLWLMGVPPEVIAEIPELEHREPYTRRAVAP